MRLSRFAALPFAALLATGCAVNAGSAEGPAGEAPQLAGQSLMWADGVTSGCEVPPSISFGIDGRVSGHAGCNNLIGGWTIDGKKLSLTQIGTTMKMCGPAFMEVEQAFLKALNETAYATQKGEAVTLWDKDGKKIIVLVPERPGKCD